MNPSIWQILIVVLAIFVLFGARRLPQVMGDLAQGIKSFKKGLSEDESKTDILENKKDDDKTV